MPRPAKGPRVSAIYFNRDRKLPYRVVVHGREGTRSSREFADETEAVAFRRAAVKELEKALQRNVAEAIAEHHEYLRADGKTPLTIETLERRLALIFPDREVKGVARWRGRETALSMLDREMLDGLYEAARQAKRKDGQPFAVKSHREALGAAKALLRFAGRHKWMPRTQVDEACLVQGIGQIKKGKFQLNLDQLRRWNAAAMKLATAPATGNLAELQRRRAVASLIALYHSVRASAIGMLQAKHIDDAGTVLVTPRIKTDASETRQVIAPVLQPILADLAKGLQPDDYLFGQKRGAEWVCKAVKMVCKMAGVPNSTAHGMRGAHASVTMSAGESALVVAAQMGHTSTAVTLAHYARSEAVAAGQVVRLVSALEQPRKAPVSASNPLPEGSEALPVAAKGTKSNGE